jgi:alpha 1,3-glucosidase
VKHHDFKTCEQSGFCKRNRQYADDVSSGSWTSPYELDSKSIAFKDGQLTGIILKTIRTGEKLRLPVTISFLESGVARVTVDEEKRQKGEIELRHNSKARKERYNEASKWAIVGGLTPSSDTALSTAAERGTTVVKYGPSGNFEAVIKHAPFGLEFKRDGETHIQFNDRGLLNVEHWRAKNDPPPPPEHKEGDAAGPAPPPAKEDAEDESTWWEESFGGNTDSKPRGPESVGLDISFPGYEFVYGIPEHAGPLALKQTRYVASALLDHFLSDN